MTCLTDRQVAQNLVSKGDVALRWYDTRWASRIVKPVDVADPALSPLGQIFGDCDEGLKALSLTPSQAAEHGFIGRPGGETAHVNELWNALVSSRSAE